MCFILIGAAVSLLYCTVVYLGYVLPVDLHVLPAYRSCCEPAVLYMGHVLSVDLHVLYSYRSSSEPAVMYCSVLGLCAPC
jgi:hypothetical protein